MTILLSPFFQVTPGSKAAIANLCIGDVITAIDGENTSNMTHLEAQNKIKGCTDNMTLTVARSEQKIWSPLVTEEGKRHPYKMNLASEPQVSTCSRRPLLSPLRVFSAFDTAQHTPIFPALEAGDKTQRRPSTATAGTWLLFASSRKGTVGGKGWKTPG